jgi:hypothetical protein
MHGRRARDGSIVRIVKQVLVGEFSPMMQSIVAEALANRSDVQLLRPDRAGGELAGCTIDVVLTPVADDGDLAPVMDLLWRWPKSRVIAIAGSGRRAIVYELQPRQTILGDLSPRTLADAICK